MSARSERLPAVSTQFRRQQQTQQVPAPRPTPTQRQATWTTSAAAQRARRLPCPQLAVKDIDTTTHFFIFLAVKRRDRCSYADTNGAVIHEKGKKIAKNSRLTKENMQLLHEPLQFECFLCRMLTYFIRVNKENIMNLNYCPIRSLLLRCWSKWLYDYRINEHVVFHDAKYCVFIANRCRVDISFWAEFDLAENDC